LTHIDDEGHVLCKHGCPLTATLADGERREMEIYLQHKEGHRVPVFVRVAPIRDSAGNVIGAVEVFSDISSKKRLERRAGELEKIAHHDSMTGLCNRLYTELKVAQAIQEVEQFGKSMGLLMIDLDRFKEVNDRFGHAAGDVVLRTVSNTISCSLRASDILGRWGGDEFIAVITDVDRRELRTVAEKCRRLIAESAATFENKSIRVTASFGETLISPGDTLITAVRRADELMYKSKESGRNLTNLG
jgi:diguanylate cyclase (GGDEF)-like protein